jgi:hypothetical protein
VPDIDLAIDETRSGTSPARASRGERRSTASASTAGARAPINYAANIALVVLQVETNELQESRGDPSGGRTEVLEIESRPIPTPVSGQVLIRVKAVGLNRSELFTRQVHRGVVRGAAFETDRRIGLSI